MNYAGADEAELDAALKESMKTFEAEDRASNNEEGGFTGTVLNKKEEPKFKTFGGAGVSLGGAAAVQQQQP